MEEDPSEGRWQTLPCNLHIHRSQLAHSMLPGKIGYMGKKVSHDWASCFYQIWLASAQTRFGICWRSSPQEFVLGQHRKILKLIWRETGKSVLDVSCHNSSRSLIQKPWRSKSSIPGLLKIKLAISAAYIRLCQSTLIVHLQGTYIPAYLDKRRSALMERNEQI